MIIQRTWGMPNKWTFRIKCVQELLARYVSNEGIGWVDPFCGMSTLAQYRNDLNPDIPDCSHLLAVDFAKTIPNNLCGVLFDPPYSGRQVKECYTNLNRVVHRDDTNAYFHSEIKHLIAPKIKAGGYAICCGWNTNGFGKSLGFEMIEVLIVAHGSSHNDTLVTVERKQEPRP